MLADSLEKELTLSNGGLSVSAGCFSIEGGKPVNEDAYAISKPEQKHKDSKGIVAVIADGVSHSSNPAQASRFCVEEFVRQYETSPASWSTQNAIAKVLTKVNNSLYYNKQDGQWLSTTSGIIFKSKSAYIFHVGDSQIIRIRNGKVDKLTNAHNQKLANNTQILTRAMGADNQLKVDFKLESVEAGDVYILTTDGVHDFISEDEIVTTINETQNLQLVSASLAKLAESNHSQDNLTCVVVKVDQVPNPKIDELHRELFQKKIPPALHEGQIIDSYQVLQTLHATTRSHIYLVKNIQTDKVYVLKAPSQNFEDDEIYIQGFIREAWIGRQIIDSKIMRIYPPINESPFLYHLCEYVEGQTLRQWMIDNPEPSIDQVRKIVEQIAFALRLLKRMEIVHRDLKPENIMISKTGQVKLIDFGAASVASLDENINLFSESTPMGTRNYIAPETIANLTITNQSDLFSLGVIAYEMFTGKYPYPESTSYHHKKSAHKNWHYQSALEFRPDIPFWLDLTLRKSVESEPEHRYDTYSQFIVELSKPNLEAEKEFKERPLIQRNPVKFWQSISGVLSLVVLGLIAKLVSL